MALWHFTYRIFQTVRRTPQIWEENGGASYSLNVAYLARGVGLGAAVERGFFFPIFLL